MKKISRFLLINLGVFLVAAGVVVFKVPNHFATGGVSGMAIILNSLIPSLPVGLIMLVINVLLLALGLLLIGLEFELKTVYATVMLSLMTWLLEKALHLAAPLTDDPMLELCMAILLIAAGSAILFNLNASSGGTDIIAKILNRKLHWHIGKAVLAVDFLVSFCAIFVFGIQIGLYSFLGVIMKGFLIDVVIKGLHSSKQVVIISSKPEEIRDYIMNQLHRGVTLYRAIGGHTNQERIVLNTVMSSREAIKLRAFIMKADNTAFIVSDNVTDIYGKGFEPIDL